MKVTLIVSGSIAAYKSAELVRELVKSGHDVHVVLTRGGSEFITSLTLQTLSGNPVTKDLFDEAREAQINHIRLADQAELVMVAPASADIIAKIAHGMADDAATTVVLATKAPVLIAPAMNVNMWNNPVTQENVSRLKARGFHFVDPDVGSLACGWEGSGRLAELDALMAGVQRAKRRHDFAGVRIVVSAGPTREAIDPMRFISNRSSGKMGFSIAKNAWLRGAEVVLVTGPSREKIPPGVSLKSVVSAQEMQKEIFQALESKPGDGIKKQYLIMAAAVCDHRPERSASEKIKQKVKQPYTLSLVPNEDILATVSKERSNLEKQAGIPLRIVGFAAETGTEEEILEFAREKMQRKAVDMLVANSIALSAEQDTNEVVLLTPSGGEVKIGVASKENVADKILDTAWKL